MTKKDFPILSGSLRRYAGTNCPSSVPWGFVEPHAAQAMANHYQTLKGLAGRGGLSPDELLAVVEGRQWRSMPPADVMARLRPLLDAYAAAIGATAAPLS